MLLSAAFADLKMLLRVVYVRQDRSTDVGRNVVDMDYHCNITRDCEIPRYVKCGFQKAENDARVKIYWLRQMKCFLFSVVQHFSHIVNRVT